MDRDQLEKLWESRFHGLEEDSLSFYRDFAGRDDLIAESPRLKELLDEIIHDEVQHATICRELLRIVRQKQKNKIGDETET
jgi:rubrerythrin